MTQHTYLKNLKASEQVKESLHVKGEQVMKQGKGWKPDYEGVMTKLDLNFTLKALENG